MTKTVEQNVPAKENATNQSFSALDQMYGYFSYEPRLVTASPMYDEEFEASLAQAA